MNLQRYNEILVILVRSPLVLFFILFLTLFRWRKKRNYFVFLVLKGIVQKKNIDGHSKYLFCGRLIENKNEDGCFGTNIMTCLLAVAAYLVTVTLQTILVVGTFQLSYDCVQETNVECFKRRFGSKIKFFPSESPLNCSSVSRTQLVFCYRMVAIEAENWFATFTAAYILVRMMRFLMFIVAWILLRKNGEFPLFPWITTITFLQISINFLTLGSILLIIFFSAFYADFAYATRHLSQSEIMQIVFIILLIPIFTSMIRWRNMAQAPKYVNIAELVKGDLKILANKAEEYASSNVN